MAVALFTFGAVKTRLLVEDPKQREEYCMPEQRILNFSKQDIKRFVHGGIEMIVLGGFAAGTAMSIVMIIQDTE